MTSPADEAILKAADLRMSDRPSSTQALELAQEQFELAVEKAKAERWAGQERWQGRENEEQRLVRILHPHAVFQSLRRAGVDARTESPEVDIWGPGTDGKLTKIRVMRTTGRLWLNPWSRAGLVGVNAWVKDEDTGRRRIQTVTTLQYPYGPEWSLMHFNRFGVLTKEKYRGWRTAMLALIFADVLTEEEVDRAFGPPTLGAVSLFYRQQLQQRRNRKMGMTA